jgi:hypothetical protein
MERNYLFYALLLGLLAANAYSFTGEYKYNSMSATAYWNAYASVMAAGAKTPMEYVTAIGPMSRDETEVHCTYFNFYPVISISEDAKVVAADGTVLGNEACQNEYFRLTKGVNKGEYLSRGGDADTPPVQWVDDVEETFRQIIAYHQGGSMRTSTILHMIPEDGFRDPVTGIQLYKESVQDYNNWERVCPTLEKTNSVDARMICSAKMEKSELLGGLEAKGEYYRIEGTSNISIDATYVVECMYYYYGGPGTDFHNSSKYFAYNAPTILDKESYTSLQDFFKVGEISLAKTIKVVKPANPGVRITADAGSLKMGAESNLIVAIENSGDTSITIKDLASNAPYRMISCDRENIAPSEKAECIIAITLSADDATGLTLNYEYVSCGKRTARSVKSALSRASVIAPSGILQVSSVDVHGGCENSYYECDPNPGYYAAGYKCMKKGEYATPANERINLEYDLSGIPADAQYIGAKLLLNPSAVKRQQKISVYGPDKAAPSDTKCLPEGDICARPYCQECVPLYESGGSMIASLEMNDAQTYSLDITSAVKSALKTDEKKLFLQVRGAEGLWATEGASGCPDTGIWSEQDVQFQENGMVLKLLYK